MSSIKHVFFYSPNTEHGLRGYCQLMYVERSGNAEGRGGQRTDTNIVTDGRKRKEQRHFETCEDFLSEQLDTETITTRRQKNYKVE